MIVWSPYRSIKIMGEGGKIALHIIPHAVVTVIDSEWDGVSCCAPYSLHLGGNIITNYTGGGGIPFSLSIPEVLTKLYHSYKTIYASLPSYHHSNQAITFSCSKGTFDRITLVMRHKSAKNKPVTYHYHLTTSPTNHYWLNKPNLIIFHLWLLNQT